MTAKSVRCLEFDNKHRNNMVYCLKQEFKFDLEPSGYSFYEVLCKSNEIVDYPDVSTFLHRLC